MVAIKQFDIYWINLDPTVGAEVRKTRPAVVISPDVMNKTLQTVIIAPLTSSIKQWPFRVDVVHKDRSGQVMLDQLRAVSHKRIGKKNGRLQSDAQARLLACLQEIFA